MLLFSFGAMFQEQLQNVIMSAASCQRVELTRELSSARGSYCIWFAITIFGSNFKATLKLNQTIVAHKCAELSRNFTSESRCNKHWLSTPLSVNGDFSLRHTLLVGSILFSDHNIHPSINFFLMPLVPGGPLPALVTCELSRYPAFQPFWYVMSVLTIIQYQWNFFLYL